MGRGAAFRLHALHLAANAIRASKEGTHAIVQRIAKPQRFEEAALGATRAGQWLAALLLGPIIVVCLVLITTLNQLMADIFGANPPGGEHTGMVGWLITAITLGALISSAWAWFQWVRTAGFGFLTWED